jgi:chromosomal replication initiation ATPase DnaA
MGMSDREFTEEELSGTTEYILLPPIFTIQDATKLAERIAESIGTTVKHLLSHSRYITLVQARKELYKILRSKNWSYPDIGRFANRDHTTIMAALYPRKISEEKKLQYKINRALR